MFLLRLCNATSISYDFRLTYCITCDFNKLPTEIHLICFQKCIYMHLHFEYITYTYIYT